MSLRRAVLAGLVLASITGPAAAQAATPELSTSHRLQDRRYAATSERTRILGFEDGRFYANGWHIAGEMGGVWSEPIKLVDGVWFGIDGQWVGQATRFTSGWGYTKFQLPDTAGLQLERTDFAPDGRRAALFGLKMTNPGPTSRTVTVMVDSHSELLAEYPWSFGNTPHASDQLPDTATVQGDALQFREQGTLPHPNATFHDYAAFVGSNRTPSGAEVNTAANGHRGPQGTNVCTAQEKPVLCDDGPFGKGQGGRLSYSITVPAGGSQTLWIGVAGSDNGPGEARSELNAALSDPAGALAAKIADRERWGAAHAALPARRPPAPGRRRLGQAERARPHAPRRGPEDPLARPGPQVHGAAGHRRQRPLGRRRLPGLPVDVRHRRRVHGVRERLDGPVRARSRTTSSGCATSPRSSTTGRGSSPTR